MVKYVSLIMDIEKSKTYDVGSRNEIQRYMDRCIQNLNNLFRSEISCEVMFSAGDELQGLFHNVVAALLYFRMLEMLVKPVKMRAGIGIGDWTVKIEPGASTQQDGPAYHMARQAINEVHGMQLQNIRIGSDENTALENHLINAALPLKRQQIYMQNMVQVLVELLFPFVPEHMDAGQSESVRKLLEMKFAYGFGRKKRNIAMGQECFNLRDMPTVSPIYIDGEIKDTEAVIMKKNMSATVAGILQCSRQNVDMIIKRGNISKIRELDYVALQYAEKVYGGKEWS